MPSDTGSTSSRGHGAEAVLGHVVVGIDATPESVVAAVQAAALRGPAGRLVLVAVYEDHLAAHAGAMALDADDLLRSDTEANLAAARELADPDVVVVRHGPLAPSVCEECSRHGATLAAVGARPQRRLSALVFCAPDAALLRDSPCSVLIARRGWGPHRPSRILLAVDRSPARQAVEAVARSIAGRLACAVTPVVGLADAGEPDLLRSGRKNGLVDTGSLADAVAAAATRDSLVVVGWDARRPKEIEQVVYGLRCSVLVVRE